ncbi:Periplasmic serine endoprotease DegP precursor [compost metagenome]
MTATPAQKAGLQKGDIITEIEAKAISSMDELNNEKNNKKVGDKITLKVYRQGKYLDITITLEEDTSTD